MYVCIYICMYVYINIYYLHYIHKNNPLRCTVATLIRVDNKKTQVTFTYTLRNDKLQIKRMCVKVPSPMNFVQHLWLGFVGARSLSDLADFNWSVNLPAWNTIQILPFSNGSRPVGNWMSISSVWGITGFDWGCNNAIVLQRFKMR